VCALVQGLISSCASVPWPRRIVERFSVRRTTFSTRYRSAGSDHVARVEVRWVEMLEGDGRR
jgi:hypothetical protein